MARRWISFSESKYENRSAGARKRRICALLDLLAVLPVEAEAEDVPEEAAPPQPQTACMSSMADKRMANLRFIDFPPLNW